MVVPGVLGPVALIPQHAPGCRPDGPDVRTTQTDQAACLSSTQRTAFPISLCCSAELGKWPFLRLFWLSKAACNRATPSCFDPVVAISQTFAPPMPNNFALLRCARSVQKSGVNDLRRAARTPCRRATASEVMELVRSTAQQLCHKRRARPSQAAPASSAKASRWHLGARQGRRRCTNLCLRAEPPMRLAWRLGRSV